MEHAAFPATRYSVARTLKMEAMNSLWGMRGVTFIGSTGEQCMGKTNFTRLARNQMQIALIIDMSAAYY
jgi:hypothetical protein